MNNKEMTADLAQYFKANGFESVKPIDRNDEKVVVENFGDCRLQLEPKAAKGKVRLCAFATSNRGEWKEFFKKHGLLSNDVINRKKDGDSGVVRESFMILGDDWEGVKKRVYDECVKMKKSMKDMEGEWPSGGGSGGKKCRDDLSEVGEAVLKDCFQTYLGHKKLLDLIQVCQEDTLSRAEKKWTDEECKNAVEKFREKVNAIDSGLRQYLDCNVFDILRMGEHEIRHSNMLAWLLDATETHGRGNEFLRSFLNEVVKAAKDKSNGVCEDAVTIVVGRDFGDLSDYKVFREDEHEDIKLMSENKHTIIVIENKWNAKAGENQLRKYRDRTDAECKVYGGKWRAIYVFLTKDGKRPEKDDDAHWIPISYLKIIEMVQTFCDGMKGDLVPKTIVEQYLRVLKRDADLIRGGCDKLIVQEVKKFCEGCEAIEFLPFVGEEYFQKVFARLMDKHKGSWWRDEDLGAAKRKCIAFGSKELSDKLKESKYCLELELDRTCSRVCCNLLRKVGGRQERKAVRWNCEKDEQGGEPIQETNVKNWKKFDINSKGLERTLEHMAENAIASVIEEVSRGVEKWGPEIVNKW